jgi:hypothetical protein
MEMPGCHQIVQDGKACEELNILEGSANAQACNSVGRKMIDVLPFETQFSFLGPVKSIDAIEDAGFPCAIGSNDGKHLPLSHIEGDPGKSGDTTEVQTDVVDF